MSEQHTPGTWAIENGEIVAGGVVVLGRVYGADDYPCNEEDIDGECKANARRIVASVNACEGVSTEALESGAVGDLVHVLREVVRSRLLAVAPLDGPRLHDLAMTALAKIDK